MWSRSKCGAQQDQVLDVLLQQAPGCWSMLYASRQWQGCYCGFDLQSRYGLSRYVLVETIRRCSYTRILEELGFGPGNLARSAMSEWRSSLQTDCAAADVPGGSERNELL